MGGFTIRAIDPSDDDALARFSDVRVRTAHDGRPGVIPPDPEHDRAWLRERPEHRVVRFEAYAAMDGERMVGAAWTAWRLLDNTDRVFCVVSVPPEERRRGAGTAMVDHLANRVREAGRTYLYTFATCLPADLEACTGAFGFARAIGAEIDQMAVRRVLGLPMDEARLRALEAEAARHSTGYVVDTFRGADSAHWDSFVELRNRLIVEQPQGSMTAEPMRTTPEALRELVEADEANGDLTWTTVATRDERVVAFTATTLPATKDAAAVLGTLVEPDHRGHRLGTAVKAANLRRLVSERPDVTRLVTENAEVNHEMVRINERFGFEVVALVPVIVLRV